MYIPFEQLSDEARIWVYQCSRSLVHEEREAMLQKTKNFLEQWASHGVPLKCSADILYDQFLILAVEENFQGVTGCAVDASIKFIRSLEQEFQIDLLDRTFIAFRQDENNVVVPLGKIKENIQQRIISADTLTFDNTVTKKEALVDKWLIRAKESWLGKYFRA